MIPSTAQPQILLGSVGWEDEDEWFYPGTADNDGHTLIRVQLYEGKDPSVPTNPERAQGHKIICQISDSVFRVPKRDTRCYVALPHGMEQTPGAGVIIACVSKNPTVQFGKDRSVLNLGDDQHVVIRGKSISLHAFNNDFVSVGEPRSGGASGITLSGHDGSGVVIQEDVVGIFTAKNGECKTMIQVTSDQISIKCQSTAMMLNDQNFYVLSTSCTLQGGAVYLGKLPTAANMALWGPTGIAGVASPSVFISPV
jgi:hypothetical protein